ncbi:MAG: DMT family transporter [Pseudomonadota bacterium]
MTARSTDRVGLAIALSLLALLLFDFMALIIKHLSPSYSAAELSAYRNFFGLIPSIIALWSARAWHQGGRKWRMRQWPLALFRGLCVTVAQFLFYLSLGQLAFATATTISYSNALFMTALAIPILGERVGLIRWSAVIVGFFGVVLIIKPGADTFTYSALAPVGAALGYAMAGVTSRLIDDDVPTPLVNLYSASTALVGALVLAVSLGGFSPLVSYMDLAWIVGMGCFGGTAVLCLTLSYRMTEQSNLAPFSYFGIPMAFALGWLFFDEAPWGDLFPGAVLIAAGGLMVIWRDRQLRR